MISRLLTPLLVPDIGSRAGCRPAAGELQPNFDTWLQAHDATETPGVLASPAFEVDSEMNLPHSQSDAAHLPYVDQRTGAMETAPIAAPAMPDTTYAPTIDRFRPADALEPFLPGVGSSMEPDVVVVHERTIISTRSLPGQKSEVVSVPWRLLAGTGLSYMVQNAVPILPAPPMPVIARTVEPQIARATNTFVAIAGPAASSAARVPTDEHAQPARESAHFPTPSSDSTQTDSLSGTNAELTRTPVWLQRLLRWQGDADETTAWVRDFQLDPKAAPALIESLQSLARDQNLTLRRIVLNGHEIWRSTLQRKPSGS